MLLLITAIGLFTATLGCVCMAVRSLGAPDHRTTASKVPVCPDCSWPTQSTLPCLCGDRVGVCASETGLGTPDPQS